MYACIYKGRPQAYNSEEDFEVPQATTLEALSQFSLELRGPGDYILVTFVFPHEYVAKWIKSQE